MNDLVRVCGARTREGGSCRRPVGAFAKRCPLHGGSSPQAREEVLRAMLMARDRAVEVLYDVLTQRPPCEHCGRRDDPAVIVQASRIVLDRTGVGPTSTVNVRRENGEPPPYTRWLTLDELRQVGALLSIAKARMIAGELPPERSVPAITVRAIPDSGVPDGINHLEERTRD